jgi:DNA mismatch repair endonuclease MutH
LPDFDYRTANEQQILERAELLEGMRLGDIPGATFASAEAARGKGEAGHAVEAWFGIPPNPLADADFPAARIELKVVPLVSSGDGDSLRVKERTVVSLIDYFALAGETWATASVRKKLKILFVYFEHLRAQPKASFPIHHVRLWEPSGAVEEQIRRDWEAVVAEVREGRAHELSEADGRILGPCTKGADSTSLRAQPFSDEPAMSRAWALKPSFTYALYAEPVGESLGSAELAENASLEELRRNFRRYVGKSIDDVASELGISASTGKGYAGYVIQAAARSASPLTSTEFEQVGPTVKMSRVNADRYPYEALSFPAFRHLELVEEEWQDSTLLSQIEHMLIVPVFGRTRGTRAGDCQVWEPVYWEPTNEQLRVIEREWTMFRDLIAGGRAASLPTELQTMAIHVRPHGRDAADRDATPGGGSQTRKSFWLNRAFVQGILRGTDNP